MHLRVVFDVGPHTHSLQSVVMDGHNGLHLVHQGDHKGTCLAYSSILAFESLRGEHVCASLMCLSIGHWNMTPIDFYVTVRRVFQASSPARAPAPRKMRLLANVSSVQGHLSQPSALTAGSTFFELIC